MQDEGTKTIEDGPWQESYTMGGKSHSGAIALAQEAIADALILHPTLPAARLADLLIDERGEEAEGQLGKALVRIFYTRGVLSARRKEAAANRKQTILPGFEHLPLKIPIADGKRIRLLGANVRTVRAYYWFLRAKDRDRQRNPRIQEAKALLEKMRKYSRTEKGITVREVLLLEQ